MAKMTRMVLICCPAVARKLSCGGDRAINYRYYQRFLISGQLVGYQLAVADAFGTTAQTSTLTTAMTSALLL